MMLFTDHDDNRDGVVQRFDDAKSSVHLTKREHVIAWHHSISVRGLVLCVVQSIKSPFLVYRIKIWNSAAWRSRWYLKSISPGEWSEKDGRNSKRLKNVSRPKSEPPPPSPRVHFKLPLQQAASHRDGPAAPTRADRYVLSTWRLFFTPTQILPC